MMSVGERGAPRTCPQPAASELLRLAYPCPFRCPPHRSVLLKACPCQHTVERPEGFRSNPKNICSDADGAVTTPNGVAAHIGTFSHQDGTCSQVAARIRDPSRLPSEACGGAGPNEHAQAGLRLDQSRIPPSGQPRVRTAQWACRSIAAVIVWPVRRRAPAHHDLTLADMVGGADQAFLFHALDQ